MIITYEIRDLFKLLWIKKAIVIAAALLCGMLAIPTAIGTYNSAMQNYTQLINKAEETITTPATGEATYFILLSTPAEGGYAESIVVNSVTNLMNQDLIARPAWEETRGIVGTNKIANYTDFKKCLIITAMPNLSLIQIRQGSIEEQTANVFIDQLIKQTVATVPRIIHIPFELKKDTNFFNTTVNEVTVNISKTILKEPSKPHNYIKLIGTAGLAGILFSCFIILLMDFLKPRIKSKEDLMNNYQVNVLDKGTITDAIQKASPSITGIVALGLKPRRKKELLTFNVPVVMQPGEMPDNSLIVVEAYKTTHTELDAWIKSIPDKTNYSILLV